MYQHTRDGRDKREKGSALTEAAGGWSGAGKDERSAAADRLPSVPEVLEKETRREKDQGREDALSGLIRSSMSTVPADEDLFEFIGLPLLVVLQPFNLAVPLPEYRVNRTVKCKECGSFPIGKVALSGATYAFECKICEIKNEVKESGEPARTSPLVFGEDGADYLVEGEGAQGRYWYSGDQLPKIEKMKLPSCRKWREPAVVFLVDSSMRAKRSGGYREFIEGVRAVVLGGDFSYLYRRFAVVLVGRSASVISDVETGFTLNVVHSVELVSECSPWFIETENLTEQRVADLIALVEEHVSESCSVRNGLAAACQLVSYTGGGKVLFYLGTQDSSLGDIEKLTQAAVDCGASIHLFSEKGVGLEGALPLAYGTCGSVEREGLREGVLDKIVREAYFRCTARVVCSDGVKKQAVYSGGDKNNITQTCFPEMGPSTTFCVSFSVEDFMKESAPIYVQCTVEYVDLLGDKRVRVVNAKLKASRLVQQIFIGICYDALFCGMCKFIFSKPAEVLESIRMAEKSVISALSFYKRTCAKEASAGQLVLPESIKTLPVLVQGVLKYPGVHRAGEARTELSGEVMPMSVERTLRFFYPRLVKISSLFASSGIERIVGERLSMKVLSVDEGYILDNGSKVVLWFGKEAVEFMEEMASSKVVEEALEQLEEKYGVRMKVVRRVQGEQDAEFIGYMIEDQMGGYPSYQDYLVQLHNRIPKR